jgi:hypothetical protein
MLCYVGLSIFGLSAIIMASKKLSFKPIEFYSWGIFLQIAEHCQNLVWMSLLYAVKTGTVESGILNDTTERERWGSVALCLGLLEDD